MEGQDEEKKDREEGWELKFRILEGVLHLGEIQGLLSRLLLARELVAAFALIGSFCLAKGSSFYCVMFISVTPRGFAWVGCDKGGNVSLRIIVRVIISHEIGSSSRARKASVSLEKKLTIPEGCGVGRKNPPLTHLVFEEPELGRLGLGNLKAFYLKNYHLRQNSTNLDHSSSRHCRMYRVDAIPKTHDVVMPEEDH
ncbi:hypothetical protein Tco_0615778 [Tanacetum coccineum]